MKNDHRYKLTEIMIKSSFTALLRDKPKESITVKELCEKAQINRATFYAHYENVPSLADAMRGEFVAKIIEAVMELKNSDSISGFFLEMCRFIASNADACEIVFGKYADEDFAISAVELVRNKYIGLWKEAGAKNTDELEMLFTYVAYGALAVIRKWFADEMLCPPEAVAQFIEKNSKANLLECC